MQEKSRADTSGFFKKVMRLLFKKPQGAVLFATYTSLIFFGATVVGLVLERILPTLFTFLFSMLYVVWMMYLFALAIIYLLIAVWKNGLITFLPLVLSIALMYLPGPLAYLHTQMNFKMYYDDRVEVVRRIEENPALIEEYEELLPSELRHTSKTGEIEVDKYPPNGEIGVYFPITSKYALPRWYVAYTTGGSYSEAFFDGETISYECLDRNWYVIEWRDTTEYEDRTCTSLDPRRIWIFYPWYSTA